MRLPPCRERCPGVDIVELTIIVGGHRHNCVSHVVPGYADGNLPIEPNGFGRKFCDIVVDYIIEHVPIAISNAIMSLP